MDKSYVFSHLTLYHYGCCIGSHRGHGGTEDRTSTEKPKGLRSKQRRRKTYVFPHLSLCYYGCCIGSHRDHRETED